MPLRKIGTQRTGIIYANHVKLGVVNTAPQCNFGEPSFIINIYSAPRPNQEKLGNLKVRWNV